MPFTELRAFGLPPAINRIRLFARRAARVLRPSPLAMSVSGIRPTTGGQRLREVIGYLRAVAYWGMRPGIFPWTLVNTYRGSLLKELSELGRLQEFGARALATGTEAPFVILVERPTDGIRIILATDAPPHAARLARLPDALPPTAGITLDLSDPMLVPLGVGQFQSRRLEALSAVLQARPDVGRRLLAGGTSWSSILAAEATTAMDQAASD